MSLQRHGGMINTEGLYFIRPAIPNNALFSLYPIFFGFFLQ